MRFSRFFQELMLVYKAELDDLQSDSEGKDVLRRRLKEKREQLPFLLPMMGSNPEMLVTAFHDAFVFVNPSVFDGLVSKEKNLLLSWKKLVDAVKLEPWAEKLATLVLAEPDGDLFLVIAACLEYLVQNRHKSAAIITTSEDTEEHEGGDEEQRTLHENGDLDGQYGRHGRDDGDDGDDVDLEEAGADWLAEQGFDRKE